MYYEHDVVISMKVSTREKEVTEEDIIEYMENNEWGFDVETCQLMTPASVVSRVRDRIANGNINMYRYADLVRVPFVLEVLDEVIIALKDWQEVYEEL